MSTIYIPDQHYVGFQCRRECLNYEERDKEELKFEIYYLGFATPFGTDKAFTKRKDTVDNWAAPTGYQQGEWVEDPELKDNPKLSWHEKRKFVPHGPIKPPEVMKNELMHGFRINDAIKRSRSWGGNNTVWRIDDPRGFQLEISGENLAQIILHCGIEAGGLIKERCVWGREGAKNVLLPENSEPYKNSITEAEKKAKKGRSPIPAAQLKPGYVVAMSDGDEYVYLGQADVKGTVERREYTGSRFGYYNNAVTIFHDPAQEKGVFIYYQKTKYYSSENYFHSLRVNRSQRAMEIKSSVEITPEQVQELLALGLGRYDVRDSNHQPTGAKKTYLSCPSCYIENPEVTFVS